MTDEKIVKALENITSEKIGDCKRDCAFYDGKVHSCAQTIALHALDLIKRQQAEIEKLKKVGNKIDSAGVVATLINTKERFVRIKNKWEREARDKAVREFAERLKQMPSVMNCEYEWLHIDIDNLLKEMTKKAGGKG